MLAIETFASKKMTCGLHTRALPVGQAFDMLAVQRWDETEKDQEEGGGGS